MGKNKTAGLRTAPGKNALDRLEYRLRAEYQVKQEFVIDFLLQVGCDAFLMASAEVFQLGKGRAAKAVAAYKKCVEAMMDNLVADAPNKQGNGDDELAHYWADLDARIKQIVGDELFVPREIRYDEQGHKFLEGIFQRYCMKRAIALKAARNAVAETEAEDVKESEI